MKDFSNQTRSRVTSYYSYYVRYSLYQLVNVYRDYSHTQRRAGQHKVVCRPSQRLNGFLVSLRDGHSTVLRYLRTTSGKITTVRTAREITFIIWVTLGTALAVYMTSTAVGRDHWAAVIWVVGLYIIARLIFALNRTAARETAGKGYISTNQEADESVDRIRIKY
jgi:hypothetical protein